MEDSELKEGTGGPGKARRKRKKTVRAIRRAYYNQMLDEAGFKTFNVFRTPAFKSAMILIACNRINPDNPHAVYHNLEEMLRTILQGRIPKVAKERCLCGHARVTDGKKKEG